MDQQEPISNAGGLLPETPPPVAAIPEVPASDIPAMPTVGTLDAAHPFQTPTVEQAGVAVAERSALAATAQAEAQQPKLSFWDKLRGKSPIKAVETDLQGNPVGAPATAATPDHLQDGTTPAMPNIDPAMHAAVDAAPSMPKFDTTTAPDAAAPTDEVPAAAAPEPEAMIPAAAPATESAPAWAAPTHEAAPAATEEPEAAAPVVDAAPAWTPPPVEAPAPAESAPAAEAAPVWSPTATENTSGMAEPAAPAAQPIPAFSTDALTAAPAPVDAAAPKPLDIEVRADQANEVPMSSGSSTTEAPTALDPLSVGAPTPDSDADVDPNPTNPSEPEIPVMSSFAPPPAAEGAPVFGGASISTVAPDANGMGESAMPTPIRPDVTVGAPSEAPVSAWPATPAEPVPGTPNLSVVGGTDAGSTTGEIAAVDTSTDAGDTTSGTGTPPPLAQAA